MLEKKKEPGRVGVSAAARKIVNWWFHWLDKPEDKRLFVQMLRDEAAKLEKQLARDAVVMVVSSTGHKRPLIPRSLARRCPCGEMTLERARARYHWCKRPTGVA